MFAVTLLTLAAASLTGVSAHGGVLEYSWGGKWYFGWAPYNSPTGQTTIQRPWATYNPIQDATATTIACNDDGTSGALQLTATVAAGTAVTAYWNQVWPHNTGPVLTYLANCGGTTCTGVNANTLKWFKIQEAGLLSGSVGSGMWAAGQMISQNSSWTTTIPKTVPSGNYLLRFETIALHSLPAQFYPECAQVTITGGGTLQPTAAQLCTLPGCYSNSDPGVNLDIYSQTASSTFNYTIPGPPLYGSTATSSTTPPKSTTTAPSNTPTTTPKPTTSTPAPTSSAPSSAPSGGTVAHYGQCGGQGWTGATACAAPYTCVVSNAYYSQCL